MKCSWTGRSALFRLWGRRKSSSLAVPPVVLRPYQEQCLGACLDALDEGLTRLGVSLPTGSGKTTVFVSLLSRLSPPPTNEKATRSLIIVNSIELARQSAEQVTRMFPDWTVEIEQGGKHVASGVADVTVATYQTLNREHRLQKFDPSSMKAVIVDEAHHAAAKSYRALLSRFHPDIKHPDPDVTQLIPPHKIPIIGFSATFGRHDGLALGSVFEHIVYHRDFLAMIKEQWLCDVRFTSVRAKLNLENVAINGRNGDFVATSLAQVVNTSTVNELIVKAWIDRASTRRSTLAFCVNVDHVKSLTQTFRKYGIDARYVFAETPPGHRKRLVADFKNGVFPVLVNCAILTEGADIPNIDCVLVARPTRSRNVFAQMIGRGMRLSPQTGKNDCGIIDFVDTNARVKGAMSAPSLFGLDPNLFDCEDETRESLEKRAANIEEQETSERANDVLRIPDPTSIIYTDHDDPFVMADDGDKATHVYSLSPFAWVACGNGIYVLELLKKGYIRIEPDESTSHYVAWFTPTSWAVNSEGASPFLRSRSRLLSAQNLAEAVRGADTYVTQQVFRNIPLSGLYRTAKWRSSPASDAQRNLVQKRWPKALSNLKGLEKEEFLAKLTKGNAATLITRIKHGAIKRFRQKAKEQKKKIDGLKKEELRVAREEIRVGPLAAN